MITLVESGINHAFVALEAISEEERQWCRERDYWDRIATEKTIRAEAIEKGMQEGLEQGIEKGKKDTYTKIINFMLGKGKSIFEIAEDLNITVEEINQILKK